MVYTQITTSEVMWLKLYTTDQGSLFSTHGLVSTESLAGAVFTQLLDFPEVQQHVEYFIHRN